MPKITELQHDDDEESEPESEHGDEDLESLVIQKEDKQKRVTIREFVVYKFMLKDTNRTKSILHLSGRLF